jgi:hypothetical protein
MAEELNVSLGLVNASLHRLSEKGYLKIVPVKQNRVEYVITAKGAAEKSRLTYSYLQYSYGLFEQAIKRVRRSLQKFDEAGAQKIVFFGFCDLARIAFLALSETGMKLSGIIDPKKPDQHFIIRKSFLPAT